MSDAVSPLDNIARVTTPPPHKWRSGGKHRRHAFGVSRWRDRHCHGRRDQPRRPVSNNRDERLRAISSDDGKRNRCWSGRADLHGEFDTEDAGTGRAVRVYQDVVRRRTRSRAKRAGGGPRAGDVSGSWPGLSHDFRKLVSHDSGHPVNATRVALEAYRPSQLSEGGNSWTRRPRNPVQRSRPSLLHP